MGITVVPWRSTFFPTFFNLDQAPEVPLQCLRLLQFGVVSPGTRPAHQASASEAVREWALCQGGEICFSCTVFSFFRIYRLGRGGAHGYRQSSGCGELANPRFPQGPAKVSGLCQFLPVVYSQFQPASRPFECFNLHQDSVQVVQRSGGCVCQIEKLLCFSTHPCRP